MTAAYRYDWALFSDWCAAFDLDPLPAHPITLARFLDAHPAGDPTQIRRVTAINSVHRRAGLIAPGRAQAIRELLNPPTPNARRTAALRADTADTVLRSLPTAGWPSGLFGRRDAMILTLSCYANLPNTTISTLQRTDFTFEHDIVHVDAGLDIRFTRRPDPRTCPVAIYLRWARLQAFHDRAPSNRAVRAALTKADPVTAESTVSLSGLPAITPEKDGPIITPFDMHGSFALRRHDRRGVNPKDVGRIVTAHLSGTARIRTVTPQPESAAAPPPPPETVVPQLSAPELDARYEAAIARRHRDVDDMRKLEDKFGDIDARTEDLLKRTEALLEQMNA